MFTLRLLGGIVVQGPSGPLSGRAAQRHPLALLALLAGSAEKGVSRDKLATYLWPDSNGARARRNLSDCVYVVRRALRDDIVVAVGDVLRLNADAIRVDVWEFEAAVERDALDEAVELYEGDFLDGFHLGDAQEFEEWAAGERRRLADLYAGALESLAELAEERREHRTAAERWKQLAAHDRYNSRAVLRLMQALIAAGDPANALSIGREHERLLSEELDLGPPPEFSDCIDQLRNQSSAGTKAAERPAEAEASGVPAAALTAASDSRAAGEAEAAATDAPPARRRRRNLTIGAIAAAALAAGIYWAVTHEGSGSMPAAEATATNRVAVLPFSYQGSEENAELGDGMAYLLSTALDGAGELTAVDPNAVIPAVHRDIEGDGAADAESARRIATRFGAGRFVLGHVTETGAALRLSAWLYERDSLVVQTAVDGPPDEFAALVDRLAAQLAVAVLGGESQLPEVAAKTTDSFEALKAYLQGESAFRSGRPGAAREAREAFGRAVQLDSTFALAWYRLALTSGWTWRHDLALHAADQAVRYSARLGFREREILNGWRAHRRGAYEESERHYTAVLARYPDDVEAWYGLGVLRYHFAHLHGQPFKSAREPLERAHALSLGDNRALALLMYEAALSGDWERSDSLLHLLIPSGEIPPVFRLAEALRRGSRQEQDATREAVLASAARASDSDLQDMISVLGGLGELDVARQLAGLLAHRDSPDMQAWGRLSSALVALAKGQWNAAQTELDSLSALQPAWSLEYRAFMATAPFMSASRADLETLRDRLTRWDADVVLPNPHPSFYIGAYNGLHPHLRLYLLGVVSARLGDYTAAHAFAEELERLEAPNAGSLSTDLAQSIRARVAWSRGAYEEALDELERAPIAIPHELTWASPFFNRAAERYMRARALQEVGRLREAAIVYETHGKYWADRMFRAPSERDLAEVYDALGDTAAATRHYGQFVRLWRDCDPKLRPFVEAAERRLAELSADR